MAQALAYNAAELRDRIERQLFWDDRLRTANISIALDNSTVLLTGTVPSFAARRVAELHARLAPGIRRVDNRLRVGYRRGLVLPTDTELQLRIIDAFIWNAHIDAAKIQVLVDRGRVTLNGTVEAYWQKRTAEDLAAEMLGVTGIDNRLGITPIDAIPDDHIAEDICAAIERTFFSSTISVSVRNGTVVLDGTVPNPPLYRAAEDIVSCTAGITGVINRLVIG